MFRSKLIVAVFLTVALQMICGMAAHAQSITLYDTSYRVVSPSNPFPRDRFARGETCIVDLYSPYGWSYYEVRSTRGLERGTWSFCYWGSDSFTIPRATNADNLVVYVYDGEYRLRASKRIPIGSK